ncbi:MAG TPA: Asp-tRNA(Asn)/Glu-tRNA(Gln) amidotransferase subunit GatC [Spirochaetota bacterium]|nr:Asp-tRNA(Asn)/Glu-tRNA(Gln) amidotransferase subunit GatC [Spirochaetota bacterium]
MQKITKDSIEHLAKLAKLAIDPDQLDELTRDLQNILRFVEEINELDTAKTQPLANVIEQKDIYREDKPSPSLPLEETIKNAPEFRQGHFIVPPVIE